MLVRYELFQGQVAIGAPHQLPFRGGCSAPSRCHGVGPGGGESDAWQGEQPRWFGGDGGGGDRWDLCETASIYGFGHGTGLCQEGAMKMSDKGFNYKDIIKYYFKDTYVVSLDALEFFKGDTINEN